MIPYKDPIKKKADHNRYMREIWYPKNKEKHIEYINNIKRKISLFIMCQLSQNTRGKKKNVGVVQWQNEGLISLKRWFDSIHRHNIDNTQKICQISYIAIVAQFGQSTPLSRERLPVQVRPVAHRFHSINQPRKVYGSTGRRTVIEFYYAKHSQ